MVAEMGTVSLEADVFEMIRMITAKNATGACKKLQTLLRLQQEPIPITAAMIGSYVDLYRVKLGAAKRKSYSTVFKDFGYKGSDYRLKRSAETASHYTLPQLEACLQILLELDKSLKSQPVSAQTLLETALCRLCLLYTSGRSAGRRYHENDRSAACKDTGRLRRKRSDPHRRSGEHRPRLHGGPGERCADGGKSGRGNCPLPGGVRQSAQM